MYIAATHLRQDNNTSPKDPRRSHSRDSSPYNQSGNTRRHPADERPDLEDEDGKADDGFGGEDEEELGVGEGEAEEGDEEPVNFGNCQLGSTDKGALVTSRCLPIG